MEKALDPGHYDQAAREDTGQHENDLLALVAFGARPALEPAFDKAGIALEERQGAEERGNRNSMRRSTSSATCRCWAAKRRASIPSGSSLEPIHSQQGTHKGEDV